METNHLKYPTSLVILIFGWIVYAGIFVILKLHESTRNYAGMLIAIIAPAMAIIVAVYAVWLWSQAKGKAKLIIGLFALSFCCVVLCCC